MKRVILVGKYLTHIRQRLRRAGFEVVEDHPDLVVTHGGDGALLNAERRFPGVPKFPIRDSDTAPHCPLHNYDMQFDLLRKGQLSETQLMKVMIESNGRSHLGLNEVYVHTRTPVNALRYQVRIDGELYAEEIFGDGVVMATAHGCTAYYRSITGSLFRVGLGLAFNNSTEQVNHIVLDENSEVEIKILRGPAMLLADNAEDPIIIDNGDIARLKKAKSTATILGLDIFMCPACRKLRHSRRRELALGLHREEQ